MTAIELPARGQASLDRAKELRQREDWTGREKAVQSAEDDFSEARRLRMTECQVCGSKAVAGRWMTFDAYRGGPSGVFLLRAYCQEHVPALFPEDPEERKP